MTFSQFYQIHRAYHENVPFEDLEQTYELCLSLPQDKMIKTNNLVIGHLSEEVLFVVYEKLQNQPLTIDHYLAIGFFKHLIDTTLEIPFHPAGVYNSMRYIHPQRISAAEHVALTPAFRITNYGPNVLFQRRHQIPIRRRQIHSN